MRSTDFHQNRLVELLQLLVFIRPTRTGVRKASKLWEKPFQSQSRCNAFIKRYIDKGYIAEQEVLLPGDARNPRLLYPKPKASEIWPDLQPLANFHENTETLTLFKPTNKREILHQLGLSEFCAELWASFAELGQRFRLLQALPTHEFQAMISIKTHSYQGKDRLVPDYTLACLIDNKPYLFFIELQHQTSVITPKTKKTIRGSFQHKLTKYKVFLGHFRQHSVIRRLENIHHLRFEGFKVLIPTLNRSQTHLENLMAANHGSHFDELFLFAHLSQLEGQKIMTQPIWLSSSQKPIRILEF